MESGFFNLPVESQFNTMNQHLAVIASRMSYENIPRYGIKIDKNNSNPETRIEYILDAVGFTPARMNYTSGAFEYGSWSDIWFVRDNYPCMLNSDGTEAYKLNPNNYGLKADGTPSDIANTDFDGNAMSSIPIVWIKQYEDANFEYIIVCEQPYDLTYKAYAHTREDGSMMDKIYLSMFKGADDGTKLRSLSGLQPMHSKTAQQEIDKAELNGNLWTTRTWAHRNLVNCLLTLISKHDNSQIAFGNGNLNYDSEAAPTYGVMQTGTENTSGQFIGYNDNVHQVKVFHIEAWWADQYDRIQGMLNVNGHVLVKMTKPYNLVGNGFYDTGVSPTGTSGGYINKSVMQGFGRIPWEASGSSATYQCDGLYFNNEITAVTRVGGHCNVGSQVGLSFVGLRYSATAAVWSIGAALSCEPPLVA